MRKTRLFRLLAIVTLLVIGSFVFFAPVFSEELIKSYEEALKEAQKAQKQADIICKKWREGQLPEKECARAQENARVLKELVATATPIEGGIVGSITSAAGLSAGAVITGEEASPPEDEVAKVVVAPSAITLEPAKPETTPYL